MAEGRHRSGLVRLAGCVIAAVLSMPLPSAFAQDLLSEGEPVKSRTKPIETFHIGRDDTRFGKLTFLGGLEVLASDRKIGGLSGLISLDDGSRFLAVTDNGHWVTGKVEQEADGTPLDLKDIRFAPLLGADGKTLTARWGHDTEALTLDGSGLYVTAETRNAVYHYPWPLSTGREKMIGEVALPESARKLPRNAGLESLAAAPEGSPHHGNLIAIAESAQSGLHDLTGYIIGPSGSKRFTLQRQDRFDATDAAFLPNGDLIVMERRFSLRDLIGLRLRRIAAEDLKADAVIEGELLLEADFNTQIDNMEALAIHQTEAGDTILTLVSDDNRSILQRTLFLRFRLEE